MRHHPALYNLERTLDRLLAAHDDITESPAREAIEARIEWANVAYTLALNRLDGKV